MTRGPKKHLKRLAAPKSWMLDKLGGVYATRPKSGPHKLRESVPLQLFLRNRLKYALTGKECKLIMKQRLVKVSHRLSTHTEMSKNLPFKLPAKLLKVKQLIGEVRTTNLSKSWSILRANLKKFI